MPEINSAAQKKKQRAKKTTSPKTNSTKGQIVCTKCLSEKRVDYFYTSVNPKIHTNGKMPICKDCINKLFDSYLGEHKIFNRAMEEICRDLNIVYLEEISTKAKEQVERDNNSSCFGIYKNLISKQKGDLRYSCTRVKTVEKVVYKDKDKKIDEKDYAYAPEDSEKYQKLIHKWGEWKTHQLDYLETEYKSWCETYDVDKKSMEDIIKEICKCSLYQRQSNITLKERKDIAELADKLRKSAELTPKQENSSMNSEENYMSYWVKKIENEKPIASVSKEFKDVDKINKFFRVWVLGHLAKMLGKKIDVSAEYEAEADKFDVKT